MMNMRWDTFISVLEEDTVVLHMKNELSESVQKEFPRRLLAFAEPLREGQHVTFKVTDGGTLQANSTPVTHINTAALEASAADLIRILKDEA